MHPSIFKAYDIRGLYPQDLDEHMARRLGKVLAFLEKPGHVLVGRDMRSSSIDLENALVEGLVNAGVSVTKIGLCSTPMFNFAIGDAEGRYDLGVMITASHNPAAYNGFKMARADCLPIGFGNGMEQIRDLSLSDEPLLDSRQPGTVDEDNGVLERYVQAIERLADMPERMPAFQIAIDTGNGMNGLTMQEFVKHLRASQIYRLFWDLDGTFPHHEANPLKPETLKDLRDIILRTECHLGVAFDGDGDRVGFMDENGEQIPGDILTALFAREQLLSHPGETVLYDLRSSWSVPEIITESGGNAVMCRVGHALIKRQMRETGALFAGELSMHFYFRDLWNCESSDLAMLLLLKIMIRERKPLSEIWKPLKRYSHSVETNFKVADAAKVIADLETRFASNAPTDVSHLDGLRMEFRDPARPEDDWWFNVRASNTEPLIRLNCEARTDEILERHEEELSRLIAR